MNNITRKPLEQIALEINQIWKTAIFEIGERLLQAKEILPHGEFMRWVEKNCPFGRTQANNYMLVYSRRNEFQEEPKSLIGAMKELKEIGNTNQITTGVVISNHDPATKEPPTADKVLDEVAGRMAKYIWNGPDITKMKELIKHRDQYTLRQWETVKDSIRRSIQSLSAILKEMEDDRR